MVDKFAKELGFGNLPNGKLKILVAVKGNYKIFQDEYEAGNEVEDEMTSQEMIGKERNPVALARYPLLVK